MWSCQMHLAQIGHGRCGASFFKCSFVVPIWFGVIHVLDIFADCKSYTLELCLQEWMSECK